MPSQGEPKIWVGMSCNQPHDTSIRLLETMKSLKMDLEIIKEDNERLVKASREQEEINEILLKDMSEMKQQRQLGQTFSNVKNELSNEDSHK